LNIHIKCVSLSIYRKPGDPGVAMAHGQAGSSSKSTIYVSPSKEVAAFPVYSEFSPLLPQEDRKTPSCKIREGQERFFQKHAQMIFEMKVKPSSCSIQKSTLAGSRHWPETLRYDKSFHTHCDLEHFVENNSDIMLSAIHPGPSIWKRSSFFACTNV